jgi:predicted TPR repeat methyltransferase
MSHVSIASFEARYERDPDPWGFATSFSEVRRYELTVAALPRPRFHRVFEPACANGELTWRLAERSDQVEAMDCSPTAVARARARCAGLPGVVITVGELPHAWPQGRFDLVVFSELGYYFDVGELAGLRDAAAGALVSSGILVGVHWLGTSEDHLLSGDEVHRVLHEGKSLELIARYRDDQFRLDVWERA